jgi:protocatechuate 3,4-dioxygenase, beta subunit
MEQHVSQQTRERLTAPRPERDEPDPPYEVPEYASTRLRHPTQPLVLLPGAMTELTGPVFGRSRVQPGDADLTNQHDGEPIGERIIVHGSVRDSDGRPVRDSLVEIWQANAAGRYRHEGDDHPAPLDPNFTGFGRLLTGHDGAFRFDTVKPGPYPWRNHDNAWRPAHVHFSLFGPEFPQRLVTQMYFPGDPLFFQDPIHNSIPLEARPRTIARYDHDATVAEWALAYRFDIVLRGRRQTPFESEEDE